jgi:hypothetical protein
VFRAIRLEQHGDDEAAAARRRLPIRWPAFGVPRPALLTAALAVIALATVGIIELASGGSNGVRVIAMQVTGPGSAQLRVSGQHGELLARGLPPPSSGHIYELWIKRGRHAPVPTGTLFSVTAGGVANVGVPGQLRGVSAVLVTQEPDGGTLVPTVAPFMVGAL